MSTNQHRRGEAPKKTRTRKTNRTEKRHETLYCMGRARVCVCIANSERNWHVGADGKLSFFLSRNYKTMASFTWHSNFDILPAQNQNRKVFGKKNTRSASFRFVCVLYALHSFVDGLCKLQQYLFTFSTRSLQFVSSFRCSESISFCWMATNA